jgi:hypothetical protein
MILDSFFDLGPATFGFTVARSYAEFSSEAFKGQDTSPNRGHDGPRFDAPAQANLFKVF